MDLQRLHSAWPWCMIKPPQCIPPTDPNPGANMPHSNSRRDFLKTSAAVSAGALTPYWFSIERTMADETKSANDRPRVGCIGNGGMGTGDAKNIKKYGDIIANCDVDRSHAERLE